MTILETSADYRLDVDPALVVDAAELVVSANLASASMLGRKLRLNAAEVAYLLELLETTGVIGPEPRTGHRPVLVTPDDLPDVLDWLRANLTNLADPPLQSLPQEPPGDDLVDLVKHHYQPASGDLEDDLGDRPGDDRDDADDSPGGELAVRPGDDLELRHPGEMELWEDEAGDHQTLFVRARQAVARGVVTIPDTVVVTRTVAVTRQAPIAGVRLVVWTPRGAKRAAILLREWVRDEESLRLLAKHEAAGEGESYAKVVDARTKRNLAGRAWLLAIAATALTLLGLAWWAPSVFAGILAVVTFLAVLAAGRSACRDPKELGGLAVAALALALLAWWQGPGLASLIPQPPGWVWLVLGTGAIVLFGLLGRKEDQHLVEMPTRMTGHEPPPITAPMIVEALFRIGVPGMTATAAEKGMRDEIRVRAPGVAKATQGYLMELELPPGITAGDVAKQREELAGALRRPLGCVWPSGGGDHPGHLRIYMGNKPMATAPQTVWPLAAGHAIDLFEPFPLFTDEEGNWVNVTLLGTHAVVAGASGFGKSVSLRQLAVACALDPRAQVYVFDGKISGDLAPLQKIAHGYYEGAEPEDIAETLAALQGIEREMRRRARFLRTLPPEERSPKVTSALASKYPHLSPIALLVDEVQEYTEYGVKGSKEDKEIRDSFVATFTRISRLGRSAGITMVLVSQKPEASVIATAIMGNCSIRICHKVTEQNHNDQVLGTSAYKNGYNAALFSQEDRGLAWLRAEGDPRVVRSWSVMVDLEPAIELVEKAYALRKARGLLTGQAVDDGIEDAEIIIDIIEDLEVVMLRANRTDAPYADLVGWLKDLRPEQYVALTVKELSARIRSAGVSVSPVWADGRSHKGVKLADLRERDRAGEVESR